uniref:proprotein convertase P-domain-containing protein n=1 Tax=Algibacter pacificus TaxID=2599389 RepID=UPI00164F80D9
MSKFQLAIFSMKVWFLTLFFISVNSFGQELCQDYHNNDVIDIPEVTGFCNLLYCQYEKTFIVPDSYTLSDVNITVNIDHDFNDDLDIYLLSPEGTQVELSTDNGGSANNYSDVTFDESSSNNPSLSGSYTLSGTYNPEGNLDDFNGENSKGAWTLIVRDDRLLYGGTIRSATLRLCYFNYPGGGYKGPGGVGHTNGTSPLVLWTNPNDITESDDDPLVSWMDLSGYGSNLSQSNASYQPIIKKNVVNGYDVVRFETGNRRLIKTGFSNFPTTAISGFYVNKTNDTGSNKDGILSYASTTSDNNFLIYRSDDLRMYRDGVKSRTFDLNADNSQWNIVEFAWTSYGGNSRMSLNGAEGTSVDANQNSIPLTAGGDFALAGEQDGSSSPYSFDSSQAHQGDFSEIILFNTYITDAERIIVSNYLSAKYDITIDASIDFYDEDENGDFDHDVAGIGQASDGSKHTDSQGTGIIRIKEPETLTDGDFLFWGRNNKTDYTFQTNTDNYKERISSNWRVSKTNGVGLDDVTVEIDMTGIDISQKQDCVPLQLVVDNDAELLTPERIYNLSNTAGDIYQATNVLLSDNDYFTLEYEDQIVWDGTSTYY